MDFKTLYRQLTIVLIFVYSITGCRSAPGETVIPSGTPNPPVATPDLSAYAFPESIDPARQYLFYLHGRIIEDQGLPAIDPIYGEYEYIAILEKLSE